MNSIKIIELIQRHFPDASSNEIEHLYNKHVNDICRELRFGVSSLDVTFEDGVCRMTEVMHTIKDVYAVRDDELIYCHWIQPNRRINEDGGVKLIGNKLPVWWTYNREIFLGYPNDNGLIEAIGTDNDGTLEQSAKLYGKFGLPYQSFIPVVTEASNPFAYEDMFDEFNVPDIAILGILSDLYLLVPEGAERAMIYEQKFDKEKHKLKKYLNSSKTKPYREMKGVPINA